MLKQRLPLSILFSPFFVALSVGAQVEVDQPPPLVTAGDPDRGIAPCSGCHQPNGGGSEAGAAARLAAIGEQYIANQIENFRNGNRNHPVMTPWAKELTDAEVKALAAYYDALPPASNAVVPPHRKREDGQWLALYGDWPNRRLPACQQCHGPLGIGAGEHFPALAGQPYSYLVSQMANWGTGDRVGDHDGMMRAVAEKLSMAEAQRVAAFYASLPAQKAVDMAAEIGSGERVPSAADLMPPGQSTAAQTPQDAEPKQRRWPPMPHRGTPIDHQGQTPPGRDLTKGVAYFQPPSRTERPEDDFGEMVAMGESIFSNTYSHEVSGKYVGNTQVCEGCHLDAGRLADSSPLWAARINYPAYRKKNDKVNTLVERVQGCFKYSMNAPASEVGTVPSAESRTIRALLSYMHWLATGAPVGDKDIPGRGYPKLETPASGFDPERGAVVYVDHCAICHGENGEGGYAGTTMAFPPLWGDHSYNWGAGMHRIDTAAAFIKANMPLGNYLELTDQQAWDVAAFMNSHERPQDPRFTGDLAETTEQFHGSEYDYYGKREGPDGKLLGEGAMMPAR
jgi:thiosulfate dehydrogenase